MVEIRYTGVRGKRFAVILVSDVRKPLKTESCPILRAPDPIACQELESAAWFAAHKVGMQTADCDDIAQTAVEIYLGRPSLWRESLSSYRGYLIRSAVRLHRRRQTEILTAGGDDSGLIATGRKPEILPTEKESRAERCEGVRIRMVARKIRRSHAEMTEYFGEYIVSVLRDVVAEIA
jgi:hypothetical protein